MKYVYGSLIVLGLVGVFFISYILNKKTPKPKDCELEIDEEKCLNCKSPFCNLKKEVKEMSDDNL